MAFMLLHWPYYHPRGAIATDPFCDCTLRQGAETIWDNIRRASEMTQD
jgi:hypothetical protein